MTAMDVQRALHVHASTARAKTSASFFKTGPGEYGEHDRFIGVTVPNQRSVARKFSDLPHSEIVTLLKSPIHEHRLTGLLILVEQYKHGNNAVKKKVVRLYLSQTASVNNWDLVDCSAPYILGQHYLAYGGEKKLYTLAKRDSLWERRTAIVATHAFIRTGVLSHTYAISERLLTDEHDLIHKAVGWMLREAGKRDKVSLERFLKTHVRHMPRTTLRYAVERFSRDKRSHWLRCGKAVEKTLKKRA